MLARRRAGLAFQMTAWTLHDVACERRSKLGARHRVGAAEDQASPVPGYCTADEGSSLTADRRQRLAFGVTSCKCAFVMIFLVVLT